MELNGAYCCLEGKNLTTFFLRINVKIATFSHAWKFFFFVKICYFRKFQFCDADSHLLKSNDISASGTDSFRRTDVETIAIKSCAFLCYFFFFFPFSSSKYLLLNTGFMRRT